MELAIKHPNDFKLGAIIGSIVPMITLGFKLATETNPWYYALVALCGTCSLLSIFTFGLASFGRDKFGISKTIFFCVVIELGWILLPYKIPPSSSLEWTWLGLAGITFLGAIFINALEFAGMMAYLHEQSEAEAKLKSHQIDEEKAALQSRIEELKAKADQLDTITKFVANCSIQRRVPRVSNDNGNIIMKDIYEKDAPPIVLYERPLTA
jgi:hypothetical protein